MPLNAHVQSEITVLVHGGFDDAERILEIIEQCGFTTTNRLMLMTNMSQRDLNDRLTDLLEAGLLDYELLEDKDAQAWFRERVPVVLADAWTGHAG